MQLTDIIRRPIITEKSNAQTFANNSYSFEVAYNANKFQIARAIEIIFQVKVEKVNTMKFEKQPKNIGRYHGFTNRYKKAIVKLAEGYSINFYPTDEVKTEDKEEKAKKANKKEVSDVEKRAAEKIAAKKANANVKNATKTATKSNVKKTTTTRKVGGE
ncbi:50S ribosomal protein L23 [Mycoplasmopsis anatis]|uniref:Large ribosomal subunit protein uL23 n=1 Tax=Mycoplasmopsis anatis 1340 TaxID=1034808 RepID=F9QD46_9BACT|nr:50S ribosomal protein L23 [Mycoplasmopsis anatis]AWX70256.1 50S ribosomal protein L23 [Mycoplasmopsis anatis]EGS29304.1 50S ribosomal protein L23 [Mycoplasmopsis anatis 1340]MBW0594276.1 50S ribosomal protein L23 [Mycoplasmopsis anatis]MBW0595099.1 50S ribosomal protein L23 [Mycoplasmopsis anatis]MBW0597966.1 50S ribosomal protein L23 [Mycoplasmopsis anatis]